MSQNLSLSVIIPSFNGAHRITNTIEAILDQTVTPDEILVVVDGSTDKTMENLSPYEAKSQIKLIYQENAGRAASRNNGAKKANGELLVFYDDDVRPAQNSLELHLAFHDRHQHAACSGFTLEDERKLSTDFMKYRRHLSIKWTKLMLKGLMVSQSGITTKTKFPAIPLLHQRCLVCPKYRTPQERRLKKQ